MALSLTASWGGSLPPRPTNTPSRLDTTLAVPVTGQATTMPGRWRKGSRRSPWGERIPDVDLKPSDAAWKGFPRRLAQVRESWTWQPSYPAGQKSTHRDVGFSLTALWRDCCFHHR